MALVKYNNNSISSVTSATNFPAGSLTHIKTLTASSSSSITFIHGSSDVVLDSTYPIYLFKFINIHIATDNGEWGANFTTDGTNFNVAKTSTYWYANHKENDSGYALAYSTSNDLANGTGIKILGKDVGTDNDQSTVGEMYLFNPSSTTFVKHFIANTNYQHADEYNIDVYPAGYANTTSAITGVRFQAISGNIDSGSFKLYGIKDS